jgi:hypothetical protein
MLFSHFKVSSFVFTLLLAVLPALFFTPAHSQILSTSPSIKAETSAASGISSPLLKEVFLSNEGEYTVRLLNGDVLTGKIVEVMEKRVNTAEEGIRLETSLGTLTIFVSEIAEITPRRRLYRHNHRAYIMPTAEPIGTNHFVGLWELLFLYGGVGITDYVSITAGRTLAPMILPEEQVTLVNVKITPYSTDIDDNGNRIFTCICGNFALVNAANQFWHIYMGGTFKSTRTSITGLIFVKANEPNSYRIRAGNFLDFGTRYEQSTFGIGAALDTRLSDRHDLHFIGELWNANVLQPSSTAILLGLRLSNTTLSMDAGIAIFTQPFFVPFASVAWTPF